MRIVLGFIFSVAAFTSSFCQEFTFVETSLTDMKFHHWNQGHMIQVSLQEYQLRQRIEFASGYNFKNEFEHLSTKFQQAIPAEYWKVSRPGLKDTLQQVSTGEYLVKWTFGKIEKDKHVTYYGQLIVHFSDNSTHGTVTRVLFKNVNEFLVPDEKKVIELYDNYQAERLKIRYHRHHLYAVTKS